MLNTESIKAEMDYDHDFSIAIGGETVARMNSFDLRFGVLNRPFSEIDDYASDVVENWYYPELSPDGIEVYDYGTVVNPSAILDLDYRQVEELRKEVADAMKKYFIMDLLEYKVEWPSYLSDQDVENVIDAALRAVDSML